MLDYWSRSLEKKSNLVPNLFLFVFKITSIVEKYCPTTDGCYWPYSIILNGQWDLARHSNIWEISYVVMFDHYDMLTPRQTLFQYIDNLSRLKDSFYNDETVVRLFYLYSGNSFLGETKWFIFMVRIPLLVKQNFVSKSLRVQSAGLLRCLGIWYW